MLDDLTDSGSESGSHKAVGGARGSGGHKGGGGSDGKPTRVRTVLNEKQLHTLRTCYAANPRPDALMKEQLVEMTGLSPRVIRVWFQNKRCKDKKKTIAMKQQMQQEKVCETMNYTLSLSFLFWGLIFFFNPYLENCFVRDFQRLLFQLGDDYDFIIGNIRDTV